MWKRFYCWLRDHPYPKEYQGGIEAYEEFMNGTDPFPPNLICSNCGAAISTTRRGMHS